jgi:trk system potassium uptake protein
MHRQPHSSFPRLIFRRLSRATLGRKAEECYFFRFRILMPRTNSISHPSELYPSLRRVSNRILIAVFIAAFASIVIEYGFYAGAMLRSMLHWIDVAALCSFIAVQAIKLYVVPDRSALLRERRIEYMLTGVVLLASVALLCTVLLQGEGFTAQSRLFSVSIVTAQAAIVLEMVFTTVRFSQRIGSLRLHPSRVFLSSFVLVILLGTLALLLPKASTNGISVVDALFTSTSAVCVTGLIVVDTATAFTVTGKLVILMLIQIGGLGLMTFTTFIALFSGRLGIRERVMLQDMLNREHLGQVRSTLKSIIAVTLVIEALGAVFLYFAWPADIFASTQERVFSSVFHSVSAFCNAGFSLFSDGLGHAGVAMNPAVNISIAGLIVLGGLGFITIVNVFSLLPGRRNRPGKRARLNAHSRIVLVSSAALIAGGAVIMFISEQNTALSGLSWWERGMAAVFQSITTRTAGFNTIDIAAVTVPGTLVILLLMFIGASPASTGGGIKTTTAAVVLMHALQHLRGRTAIEIRSRSIAAAVIDRAHAALLFGMVLVFVATLALSAFEAAPLIDLLFEAVSAMATVGLSRGITAALSDGSKIVLILTMLIGRVGVLTFMQSLSTAAPLNRYDYPTEHVIVG